MASRIQTLLSYKSYPHQTEPHLMMKQQEWYKTWSYIFQKRNYWEELFKNNENDENNNSQVIRSFI